MHCTDRLVLRANEIFHDIEGEAYGSKHRDIFVGEKKRWARIGGLFIKSRKPLKILDIGSGTGFVPLQLMPFLKKSDSLICSDISSKMLQVCRSNLHGADCVISYLKLSGRRIPLKDRSVDVVTLNSVLHHMPDCGYFLNDASRILRKGGLLVIAHEPNSGFCRNLFLWGQFYLFSKLFGLPHLFFRSVLRLRSRILGIKREVAVAARINEALLGEGLISKPLSGEDIAGIVDFHSPSACGLDRNKGIGLRQLLSASGFFLVHFESYRHLSKLSGRNHLFRAYNSLLARIFPMDGALSLAIAKKSR